jgi:alpha-beta hydrolase superfamily lysophospholipase
MPPHETIALKAKDEAKVYGYLCRAKSPIGILLLFHQAGSSAYEYAPLISRLTSLGWDCLAVDLRSGGSMYGPNRTVEVIGQSRDYLEAYQDMEAATEFAAQRKYGKIVAWGSSYSASLVAKLANDHGFVTKIVAFSPGEYMDDKSIVRRWYSRVKVPALAVWAGD